jgi:hypothetical protein
MTNFVPVAFLDTFDLACSLRPRLGMFKMTEHAGLRTLPLRGFRKDTESDAEDFVMYAVTTKWVELSNMRGRLKRIGDQSLGEVEFGRIWFEMLDPGAVVPWQPADLSPYAERWTVMHLPVRTNPGAVMYAGTEQSSPGAGWLTVVNARAQRSAVNLGDHSRIHLVAEFRKNEVVDA